jgi:hypothetical protein
MDYDAPLAVHEKAFLDFFVLGSASKIFSLISDGQGLYKSNFPFFASQILDTPFERVTITNEADVV